VPVVVLVLLVVSAAAAVPEAFVVSFLIDLQLWSG
jgi:hypothetical protein